MVGPVGGDLNLGELAYKDGRRRLLKRFGANLRRVRRNQGGGVSQEHLAALTGLHRTEIGKLEQGVVEPKLSTLLILAEGLDVSVEELLEDLSAPAERKPAPGGRRGAPSGERRGVGGT
jgi:transcriptional regulator with XRE-family HTH domain